MSTTAPTRLQDLQDKRLAAAAALAGVEMEIAVEQGDLLAARDWMDEMYSHTKQRLALRAENKAMGDEE